MQNDNVIYKKRILFTHKKLGYTICSNDHVIKFDGIKENFAYLQKNWDLPPIEFNSGKHLRIYERGESSLSSQLGSLIKG